MSVDYGTMDYHCWTCGSTFNLDPTRQYLVFPIHCDTCMSKIADGVAKAFDAVFSPPTAPECFQA